jgi:hypothetical protein
VADPRLRFGAAGLGALAAAAALYACDGPHPDEGTAPSAPVQYVPDRAIACQGLSGTAAERLTACLADLGPATLSADAVAVVDGMKSGGKVLVAGDAIGTETPQTALAADAGLQTVLLASDEPAAAKALRDGGYRGVVVHRDLTAALDRDKSVISRLAQHDFLEWFELQYVGPDALIYTIRATPARITDTTGESLLAGLRARLAGTAVPHQTWHPSAARLIGGMRLQGEAVVLRHAVAGTGDKEPIEAALDDLADKMRRRWEREIETDGFGTLEDALKHARLEIHVVLERAPVEPHGRWAIFDLWELGVDGMMLRAPEGAADEHFTYMPGSEATARSIRSADEFLQYAAKENDWRDRRPWELSGYRLDIFRDDEFIEKHLGGGEAVRLVRGMPEVPMSELTDENIRQMLVDGGEWWLRNQHSDGSFVYKYWPDQNRFSTDYNEVRHILAARDLADTWRYRHDPRYLAGSRKAMDWLLKYQIQDTDPADKLLPSPPSGAMLFRYPDKIINGDVPNQKLGTVAVALLGWVAWAEATGSHEEDARIRKMATYVLSRRLDNGKFEPYDVPSVHPYYGEKNDIVPGEAGLALGRVAQYFQEPKWLEYYPGFVGFYRPWFEERAKRRRSTGVWPATIYDDTDRLDLVQFGPWSVMAARQYYEMTGDVQAAEFGLEVADWMIDSYQWSGDRSPWPDYVGGYYKMPTELPAMQTFCYSEGTAAAYAIALKYAPEKAAKYDNSTREALRFLRVMQYDDVDSYAAARADLIHGGIKYAMNEGKVRIDYVGHGLSTVSQYLDTRAKDPNAHFALVPIEVDAVVDVPAVSLPPAIGEGGGTDDAPGEKEGGD